MSKICGMECWVVNGELICLVIEFGKSLTFMQRLFIRIFWLNGKHPVISEVPFIPEIFQWNEPKTCVPFTSQFSEFLGKCKMPKLKANAKDSVLARTTYNKARNQVVKLITDAKSIYLKERIVENKNNTRKLWKLLKQ